MESNTGLDYNFPNEEMLNQFSNGKTLSVCVINGACIYFMGTFLHCVMH
jgi:hypothetical protein